MDKLQAMATFVRVVEARSFSKAAQSLAMPRSSVTTLVKNLETHLGTPLLRRSTRRLSLTDAGARYLQACQAILTEIASAESDVSAAIQAPRGRVRVDMPGIMGRAIVVPRLVEFEARYPDIDVVLGLSDRPADLIFEGIDCAIRSGALADSTLVARSLGQLAWLTCASPMYLARFGEPESLDSLQAHRVVNYLFNATGRPLDWRFRVGDETVSLTLPGRYAVNETEAYLHSGLEGLGLIQLSELAPSVYLSSGRLREVLAQARCEPVPVSIVYPNARATAAVKALVEWVVEIARPALAG